MVNFNFGLGDTGATDGAQTTQDPAGGSTAIDPNTAVQTPADTGGVTDDSANPFAVPTTPVATPTATENINPFETSIPAAEENIFVTPPAEPVATTPVIETKPEPTPVADANPFAVEIPSAEPVVVNEPAPVVTETTTDNIFANPVPMATTPTEPVIAEPQTTPVVDVNPFAVEMPTMDEPAVVAEPVTENTPEPKPFEPIFADTPAPVVESAPTIEANPFETETPAEVKSDNPFAVEMPVATEEPAVITEPVATTNTPEPKPFEPIFADTAVETKSEIKEESNIVDDFNPFADTQPEPAIIAETPATNVIPDFNPFGETEEAAGSTEPAVEEKPITVEENNFNPFGDEEVEPVISTPEPETQVEIPVPVAIPDFIPFAETQTEEAIAKPIPVAPEPVIEAVEVTPLFGATDDSSDDSSTAAKQTSGSHDPLQTLMLVKTDIENYINKQEGDIAELNSEIDYHKDEIKDLRSEIKDKEKHIKAKKSEFEKMIKDIENTLTTKFEIKK